MKIRTICLIVVLAHSLLVSTLPAEAQQSEKIRRIGFLQHIPASISEPWMEAFREGLRDLGWIEGKNISIEVRWAERSVERRRVLAEELVHLKPELIVVHGVGARDIQRFDKDMPIVIAEVSDAVGRGLVQSLAHPGGNITGLTSIQGEIGGKRLELLKEIVPNLTRVGVLWTPINRASKYDWKVIQPLARQLGLQLYSMEVRSSDDFVKAYEDAARAGVDALATTTGVGSQFKPIRANLKRINELAVKARLPLIHASLGYMENGGLIAYSRNLPDMYRRAATYVDKILRGAKPADLPVEQPIKFDLVVNLKTAKALGITIPPTVLYQATEVIR